MANNYDNELLEIVVVDAMSTDRTREIVKEYCQRYPQRIKLIDNTQLITPVAMNLGIKAASNELVMISSSHAEYSPDYISNMVNGLVKHRADA